MSHAYMNYVPAFPKPSQMRRELPHVKVFPGGREVCQTRLDHPEGSEGRAEYKRRKDAMWKRQKGICCLYGFLPSCPGKLLLKDCSFDHENKRGAGGSKRDDRILVPEPETGRIKWQNGACHGLCNGIAGSRYFPYNEGRYEDTMGTSGAETPLKPHGHGGPQDDIPIR